MWIVKIALERPYTFIVLAILILIAAPVVILNTPTDIFPSIDILRHLDCVAVYGAEPGGVGRPSHDAV